MRKMHFGTKLKTVKIQPNLPKNPLASQIVRTQVLMQISEHEGMLCANSKGKTYIKSPHSSQFSVKAMSVKKNHSWVTDNRNCLLSLPVPSRSQIVRKKLGNIQNSISSWSIFTQISFPLRSIDETYFSALLLLHAICEYCKRIRLSSFVRGTCTVESN